jgi:hypothetical protein
VQTIRLKSVVAGKTSALLVLAVTVALATVAAAQLSSVESGRSVTGSRLTAFFDTTLRSVQLQPSYEVPA